MEERELSFPPKWVGDFLLKITTKYLWKVVILPREGGEGKHAERGKKDFLTRGEEKEKSQAQGMKKSTTGG